MEPSPATVRERLECALAGEPVRRPAFVVYDWFVRNRPIDWASLYALGLGQINHADLATYHQPNVQVVTTYSTVNGETRKDVRLITDIGELHEWYLGEWRQEYLIKTPQDYRIMQRVWEDSTVEGSDALFEASEAALGDRGLTVGQLDRTPFQKIQIDYAGLGRFSMDIADRLPELLDLLDVMNEVKLQEFRVARNSRARHLKLWENLSIETMGPVLYRKYLVPMYHKIFAILDGSDKKLQVHYDGKLRIVADEIARLPFDGLDSLTPPPEGDLTTAESRARWPDKFFWLHPSLTWYSLEPAELVRRVRQMAEAAGPTRYCLMISEEIPPGWQTTVPAVLRALAELAEMEG